MARTASVALTPDGTEILKQSHSAFCNVVKGKFGCIAELHNVGQHNFSFVSSKSTRTSEILYTKQLPNSLEISVWKDDLTKHTSDAVVNAANEQLSHGGGLALALSQAGGPLIQQWSAKTIQHQTKVHTGDAIVGPPGRLPCKKIIHAVGPHVSLNPSQADLEQAQDLLHKAILRILELTETEKLQSVAIPALSSGIFNFPLILCAEVTVKTVNMFSKNRNPGNRKLEVRLVNNDDPTVKVMQSTCVKFLGPADSGVLSGAVQNQHLASAQSVIRSLELGNITLHLKKGPIEQQTTDVIVNPTGPELNLFSGMVSKALLEKAGNKIQDEIRKNHRHRLAYEGEVIETGGHNLNCRKVFHTVCSSKNNKILRSVVMKCLENANNQGVSSISFPALGTGTLGFHKDEVSKIMTNEVLDFANFHKKNQQNKFDIYFVIFPKDTDLLQAFERDMALTEKGLLTPKTSSSTKGKGSSFYDSAGYGNSETAPSISIHAESPEALREAQLWINNILHRSLRDVTISNNHLVHFGQKEHDKLNELQAMLAVYITEIFSKGNCGVVIKGDPVAVSCAALEVENMLCHAQEQLAKNEEHELKHWHDISDSEARSVPPRTLLDPKSTEWKERLRAFQKHGLIVENVRYENFRSCLYQVEKIDNHALKNIFQLNKKRVSGQPQRLYQRVTAQFCNLICRVGFQREYAPPKDQAYGAGIYFTTEIQRATSLWPDDEEEFIYFIEAQVFTGNTELGSPGLIVPPPNGKDPLVRFDSVSNARKDIYVIFNGHQALPEFLITCRK